MKMEHDGSMTPCPKCGRVIRIPDAVLQAELEGKVGPFGNVLVCVWCAR